MKKTIIKIFEPDKNLISKIEKIRSEFTQVNLYTDDYSSVLEIESTSYISISSQLVEFSDGKVERSLCMSITKPEVINILFKGTQYENICIY